MIKAIYKITNLINGKIYVGQSVHPEKRWTEHKQRARNHCDNYPIHLAISKYGEDNFNFEIIEWTPLYEEREKFFTRELNALVPNGYNLIEGGHSPILFGEDNSRNTISREAVLNIIKALKENALTDREIAIKYNTTDKIVADINHGYTHRVETETYPIRVKRGRQILSEEEVKEIKNLLINSSFSFTEIAKKYNTTKTNISQINNGRSFDRFGWDYPLRKVRVRPN